MLFKRLNGKCQINAFSVDVEGFVESNVQSFHVPDKYVDPKKEDYEIEKNVDVVLNVLEEVRVKATFFVVGRIAKSVPQVVTSIAKAGHEVGCHNYKHLRIFDIEKETFRKNISETKKTLEDISGQQVYGFRAPDFSITEKSIWALDILKELGFVYDTSIYPFGLHDVYGIKDAEVSVHILPNGLIEFPMSTTEIAGKRIPFGGGGYFRLYPIWLTKIFMKKLNRSGTPGMFYIHPYEIGPIIPKIKELSSYRKFRHYYHCANQKRIKKLLNDCKFAPAIDVLKSMGIVKGN